MRIIHLAIVIIDWSVVPLESIKLTDSFGSVSCHTKISLHRPLWVVPLVEQKINTTNFFQKLAANYSPMVTANQRLH